MLVQKAGKVPARLCSHSYAHSQWPVGTPSAFSVCQLGRQRGSGHGLPSVSSARFPFGGIIWASGGLGTAGVLEQSPGRSTIPH